ncbi:MAG: extracellular solute-binding protein, partial [Pseudomonadota bacterium]
MHFRKRGLAALACAVSMAAISATQASATEINFMISDVDGKVGTLQEFIDRYKEVAPDVTISLNQVGYNVIREQLPSQLEAGTGPDMAFVTNLGGLNPYYVDLAPYVDADAWEDAYGAVLAWYRVGDRDGIYAFHTELTV